MEDLKTKNPSVQGKEVETSVGFFDEVVIPPDWLTQNYVQTVLQKYENDPKLKVNFRLSDPFITSDSHCLRSIDHQLCRDLLHSTRRQLCWCYIPSRNHVQHKQCSEE